MHTLKFLTIFSGICLITSCGNNDEDTLDESVPVKKENKVENVQVSEETMTNIIQSIPSPVEISSLIKATGAEFDENILNSSDNADKYNNSYKKALGLGVYGADLGYINLYEKSIASLSYLGAIRNLANDLKIGQFFDFSTLKRLSSNSKNMDSLLFITTNSFNNMDGYLREQKRSNLSVLIVTGTWLEGLHIACEVAAKNQDTSLVERIGEQKLVVDNIALIVSAFRKEPYFFELSEELNQLKDLFKQVEIVHVEAEPEMKEVNGQLVIVDNSRTSINISAAQVTAIQRKVNEMRKKFILI